MLNILFLFISFAISMNCIGQRYLIVAKNIISLSIYLLFVKVSKRFNQT